MTEYELPVIQLTFNSVTEAYALVSSILQAKEQVIWQQRALEDGTVVVEILSVTNLETEAQDLDES